MSLSLFKRYISLLLPILFLWNSHTLSALAIEPSQLLNPPKYPTSLISYQHPPESPLNLHILSTTIALPLNAETPFSIQALSADAVHSNPSHPSKALRLLLAGGMFVVGTALALNSLFISLFLGGLLNSFEAGTAIFVIVVAGGIILSLTGLITGIVILFEPTVDSNQVPQQTFSVQFSGFRF